MPRYIDADALMRELGINDMDCGKCGWGQYGYCKRGAGFTDACFAIENAPTVDIVRCKDCKHLSADRIAPEWNRICRKYGVGKSDDGFCDEVERKETEDGRSNTVED